MGGSWSSLEREEAPDPWWPTEQLGPATVALVAEEEVNEESGVSSKGRVRKEDLEVFKEELARKRALRHEAIAAVQAELKELRGRAEEERKLREQAEAERDELRAITDKLKRGGTLNIVAEEDNVCINTVLEVQSVQQRNDTEEGLRMELERERKEKAQLIEERDWLRADENEKLGLQRQIQALKDVSEIGKEMLKIRELQVKELKRKLVEVNMSAVMAPPDDLRVEYEKQIENIRKLRTLYEERAAATSLEHRRELEREEARVTVLEAKLSDLQKETDEVKEEKKELEDKIEQVETSLKITEKELESTKEELFSTTVQKRSLNSQVTLINKLFSQMLISPKVDLDRLTRLLQENHGLIKDLTEKGDCNEVAALLVDLAEQIEKEQQEDKTKKKIDIMDEKEEIDLDISSNLTKVWRVLVELLSHHDNSILTEQASGAESCYKCVQTPSGPRSVISVSQTFLTLKDLILEKNHLVKEVGRLKTLNTHLENRLGNQEKRLSVVTQELRKTWGVVNKLKAQHKQLHTHEKILRYELHQKRCMLTELKQELEHCRDKWDLAREKNSQTEEDWKKLRKEFAARKTRKESNSAESGYEEDDTAQSPPPECINQDDLFGPRPTVASEPEVSEDDIEHSDGNSFDTVIDLLDIAFLENQSENPSAVPLVLSEIPSEVPEISANLLPLTGSEFTEGLDQIESEDLAAVLDVQYQNQLLGADYNLSLPSSSGSSPIPTENDDFASSEMDVSEEDSMSNSNLFSSPSLVTENQGSSNNGLLFGSNSLQNILKFMDGIFVDNHKLQSGESQNIHEEATTSNTQNLTLNIPSSSLSLISESNSATPIVSQQNFFQTSPNTSALIAEDNNSFESLSNEKGSETDKETPFIDHKYITESQIDHNGCSSDQEPNFEVKCNDDHSETRSQEEILKSREDRLKKLEYQCRSLVNKVTSTSFRSDIISNKLDELHLSYGPSDDSQDRDKSPSNRSLANVCQDTQQTHSQTALQVAIPPLSDSTNLNPPLNIQNISLSEEKTAFSSCGSSSSESGSPVQTRTPEQILEARAARLKRLEDQCKSLFCKMSATSSRSELISNKLDELHESYGGSEQSGKNKSAPNKNTTIPKKSLFLEGEIRDKDTEDMSIRHETEDMELKSDSKEVVQDISIPGPSSRILPLTTNPEKIRTTEQMFDARSERFKRLEDQCKSLVSQMTATSIRRELISNKLDKLHSTYGSSEDASDSEDSSLIAKEDRKKPTPSSSPRYLRKLAQLAEKRNETDSVPRNSEEVKFRLSHTGDNAILSQNPTSSSVNKAEDLQISTETCAITEPLQSLSSFEEHNRPECSNLSRSFTGSITNIVKEQINDNQENQIPITECSVATTPTVSAAYSAHTSSDTSSSSHSKTSISVQSSKETIPPSSNENCIHNNKN